MEETKLIQHEKIIAFISELFTKGGMSREHADWYAVTIANANLRGIDSHGILRVPVYFDRILCKAINPAPSFRETEAAPAVSLLDADGAAGCIAGKRAMELAVEHAKQYGVGVTGVINSNHFGAAAQYAQLAVDEGMAGLSMTNVPALLAAPGVKKKLIGNNPMAIGIPTYSDFPFMLDMSMSVVAEGKLRFAASKGMKIPTSWAADADGNPTDDPEAALNGFLLPVGGYKGLGLAYAVDILSGVITGGAFADKLKSMYRDPTSPMEVCHLFAALNVNALISREELKTRMQYYHDYLLSAPLADGAAPLCFPGEIEHNCEVERRKNGVPVPVSTLQALEALKNSYGVTASLE